MNTAARAFNDVRDNRAFVALFALLAASGAYVRFWEGDSEASGLVLLGTAGALAGISLLMRSRWWRYAFKGAAISLIIVFYVFVRAAR